MLTWWIRVRTWHAIVDRYLFSGHSVDVVFLAAFFCNITGGAWSNPENAGYILCRVGNPLFVISSVIVIGTLLFLAWISFCKPPRWPPCSNTFGSCPICSFDSLMLLTNHSSPRLKIPDPKPGVLCMLDDVA